MVAGLPGVDQAEGLVDLDGSGLLHPFKTLCRVSDDGDVFTVVAHDNLAITPVDGFEEKGSFYQVIHYEVSESILTALLNRSTSCYQSLSYECKQSLLFDTTVPDYGHFAPYGWWVSHHNQSMDYWAGSYPGSRQCGCGLVGTCHNPYKGCNCDSGYGEWLEDAGNITQMEHLPVRALHFGDTGTPMDSKMGRFQLGPLVCSGDTEFSQEIHIQPGTLKIELERGR